MSTVQTNHGRVDENGNIYVLDAGVERLIGSQPELSPEDALALYVKKYDDLVSSVRLLEQRVKAKADAKSINKSALKTLEELREPQAIGDIQTLRNRVVAVQESIITLLAEAAENHAKEVAAALLAREALVTEAEKIAASNPLKTNYKVASAKMIELFATWQSLQKSSAKVSKKTADELWHRFSKARNTFDANKRSYFASQDALVKASKTAKSDLVAKAEALVEKGADAAIAYRELLDAWKALPKTKTKVDDTLWARFKVAGDAIYAAKSARVEAENVEFAANLKVKLEILEDAEKIDVTDLDAAKSAMKNIQARWEKAGKVPRDSIKSTEDRLKAVEQKIRNIEAENWRKTDPSTIDRTNSVRSQLEASIAKLEMELAQAKDSGDAGKIAKAQEALETKQAWLAVVVANA
ncbi:MAG: DUF349 domain-containing protein [Micrococcales bacterium]|nr:DUF349 domain-containing protein [Actinomycetota bacterium]NCA07183.1 DUF349 domain-containing protein [Micrococcales bacterium]